jgi:TolA-binding protein
MLFKCIFKYSLLVSTAVALTLGSAHGAQRMLPQPQISNNIVYVQSGGNAELAVRIDSMEQQIRGLTGMVETLQFELNKLQEQLRRQSEESEFRFQELEKTGADVLTAPDTNIDVQAKTPNTEPEILEDFAFEDVSLLLDAPGQGAVIGSGLPGVGAQLIVLPIEVFEFDTSSSDDVSQMPISLTPAALENSSVNLMPMSAAETQAIEDRFLAAAELIRNKRYVQASSDLQQMLNANNEKATEARTLYLLGETHLGQNDFVGAARSYLNAYKVDPNSEFAPLSMVRLAVALAEMGEKTAACTTLAEALIQYPSVQPRMHELIDLDQSQLKCS